MKKLFCMIVLFVSARAYGQIEYTDSVRHITVSGYAGVLSWSSINVKDAKIRGYVTMRIGGMASWTPKPFVTLFGLAAGEINEVPTVSAFSLLGLRLHPHKKLAITVGKIATPMTELTPLPATKASHFITWTEARIPGSAYGGKITYRPTEKFSIVSGGFWRGADATAELGIALSKPGIKIPIAKIAGYYLIREKSFGAATTIDYKWLSVVASYNHCKTAGLFTSFEIPKTQGLKVFSDIGFDPITGKMIRGEWGFSQPIDTKWLRFLTVLTYNQINNAISMYFMAYLKN